MLEMKGYWDGHTQSVTQAMFVADGRTGEVGLPKPFEAWKNGEFQTSDNEIFIVGFGFALICL